LAVGEVVVGLRRTWILDRRDGERIGRGFKGQVEESGFGIEGRICGIFVYGVGWWDFDWRKIKIRGYRL
jgi:hypothetical protein